MAKIDTYVLDYYWDSVSVLVSIIRQTCRSNILKISRSNSYSNLGLGLGTLIDYAITINPSIIVTALISTAAIFVCFSVASLTAERGRWLYLGGTLLTFLTVLIGLSFANIFFGSHLLFQVS